MSDPAGKNSTQRSAFLHRWSQRKLQNRQPADRSKPAPADNPVTSQTGSVTGSPAQPELPPLESLHEDSEISMFLHEGVSEQIKRQALRKLFHMDKFNVCDGLDDYAEDYTAFQPLGEIITAYQRLREEQHRLEQAMADNSAPSPVEPQHDMSNDPSPAAEPHPPEATDTDSAHTTLAAPDDKEV